MNIDDIYAQIDSLYTQNDGKAVEELLLAKIEEAIEAGEENIVIQLLNELVGHYRKTGEFDKCLNVANAYRAVGLLRESSLLYQQVKNYYDENVDPASMLFASLYNNMALLFQEMGDFESANDCLTRALGISNLYPECRIEQASTHANIAATLINLDRVDEAENHLLEAFKLFEMDEAPDYRYSVALSAMAELKFAQKQYAESARYYEKAMGEVERHMGRSEAYEILKHNLDAALDKLGKESESALKDLDHYTEEIMRKSLVEKIVNLEWEAFDKVQNQGGRASCQDDFTTFSIMRRSQYLLWSREMLESFITDFETALSRGWNLITEKYGRMEESTAPKEYDKIKQNFPEISEEKKQIIEAIVAVQVGMMEDFAKDYPNCAREARSIHTYEDTPFNTSYETYLRGEISTYSDETLALYGRFVADFARSGRNIARDTIANSAILYGYESLEAMEKRE